MSRAVFLDMSELSVVAHCEAKKIGISSIGGVLTGGTRLVCMSVDGAGRIRSGQRGDSGGMALCSQGRA
jgi:hypothetical protein